jgi:predicted nucleotidyltransferase
MDPAIVERLRRQLDRDEADLLATVLSHLAAEVHEILGADLAGVYLKGSFALGSGDVHSDVDFLVATRRPLSPTQESAVRGLHAVLPDREEHWAHHLEGSYASVADLRLRADAGTPWLYVDNGNRAMEWSSHDNTEVFRWVLHRRAPTLRGTAAATLLDAVPPHVLRQEAARLATSRRQDIADDPDYLRNRWGQSHEVLTRCRLLFTATRAEVTGKTAAARWCRGVVPEEWHDLIDGAIADRPDPWLRVRQAADPVLATRTWEFVEVMTPLIVRASTEAEPGSAEQ